MKLFDSHCHYNDLAFSADTGRVLEKIRRRGVVRAVDVGADAASSLLAAKQAEENDFLYFSRGIHPDSARERLDDEKFSEIEKLLSHPKAVAVGEAGLDFHYDDRYGDEIQKEAFIRQIDLANRLNLPLIIHSRDAFEPTLKILKERTPKKRVIHCFSGSREGCKILTEMGFYIGFTGVVTFKNARRALEALRAAPKDRILIETDCPYMAPVPFRGKRCDSSMLTFTAEKIGETLGMTAERAARLTCRNAARFYGVDLPRD